MVSGGGAYLVEIVFVELPDETGEVIMLEVLREEKFGELGLVLDPERVTRLIPAHNVTHVPLLQHPTRVGGTGVRG